MADQAGAAAFVIAIDVVDVFGACADWTQRVDGDHRARALPALFKVRDNFSDPLRLLQFDQGFTRRPGEWRAMLQGVLLQGFGLFKRVGVALFATGPLDGIRDEIGHLNARTRVRSDEVQLAIQLEAAILTEDPLAVNDVESDENVEELGLVSDNKIVNNDDSDSD